MVAATQGRAGIAGLAPVVQLTQKLFAFEGVEVRPERSGANTRSNPCHLVPDDSAATRPVQPGQHQGRREAVG
jgi:hypothetical protein